MVVSEGDALSKTTCAGMSLEAFFLIYHINISSITYEKKYILEKMSLITVFCIFFCIAHGTNKYINEAS